MEHSTDLYVLEAYLAFYLAGRNISMPLKQAQGASYGLSRIRSQPSMGICAAEDR